MDSPLRVLIHEFNFADPIYSWSLSHNQADMRWAQHFD